jgi:hypothetical protein
MVLNTVNWGNGGKGGAMRRLGPEFVNHPLRVKSRTDLGTVRSAAVAVASLVALAMTLAGCGAGSAQTLDGAPVDAHTPAAPTGLSAPALSGPQADLVLRVYRNFWAAQVRAMATGQAEGQDLSTFATGNALSDAYANVVRLTTTGLRMSGAPHNDPRVTAVGPLPGRPGESQATLIDCFDPSNWHQITAKGGKLSEPAHRLSRYPLVVTARTVGGVWMISDISREAGRTC